MADFEAIIKQNTGEEGNIPADAIGAIVTAIKQAVGNEFVDKSRYKAKLTEIDNLKDKLQTAEDNALTAGKWEEKYNDLKGEFDNYKTEQENKAVKSAKEKVFREFLSDMKVSKKGIEKIFKWQGVDGIELDEDGNLKDANSLRKSIKEDWEEYITKDSQKGANTETPPNNNGGTTMTKEEIMKIKDATERQQAIADNPSLFGLA